MRRQFPRARAALGTGALTTAVAAAGATAAAQQPAPAGPPQQPGATVSAGSTTAKDRARLSVTRRRLNVRVGRVAGVSGRLHPARAGRVVTLERLGGRGWKTIDKARTSATGRFELRHRSGETDAARVRIRFRGDASTRSARRHLGRLRVFRPALASWYGPGLYGGALACGGRLEPGTVGVAHKSLPCGKRVVLRNGGRIVRARVIDRGPFVGGREFDLTAATKERLGFGSTGTVYVAH